MNYQIEDVDLNEKLSTLKVSLPETIALFPENIETAGTKEEFIFTDSAIDLKKIFKQENISLDDLGNSNSLYRTRKNADIYLPAIFIGISAISENPNVVSVALNIVSSYVYDLLKGSFGRKTAHIDFYIETKEKGKLKKLSYNGSADGLKELNEIIKNF